MCFEDAPMIVLNARLVLKYKYVDTAMILSLLFSASLAGKNDGDKVLEESLRG